MEGNPFDIFLHRLERLESIPALLFSALLLILTTIPGIFNLRNGVAAFGFILVDWALLAMLPKRNKSYGPARPPVLLLAVLRTVLAFLPLPVNLVLQSVVLAVVYYSTWVEPHRIRVTRMSLQTRRLPEGLHLRILHLGDLHLERITARENQLLKEISRLEPDIILFSGDFLNLTYLHDAQTHSEAFNLVNQWRAPMGVFGVSGSPAVDLPEVVPGIFKNSGLHFLEKDCLRLEKSGQAINLSGLACTHNPVKDGQVLDSLFESPPEEFTILLYHSPDLAPWAAGLGVDLQLSGHTHGGQIRFPLAGPLFTGSLYGRAFQSGAYRIGGMILYITRGLGMEGAGAPRARFMCPPEIILWEINP